MTMSTCKVICVTNRHLVRGDFLIQLRKVASAGVDGVILREKDMPKADYLALLEQAAAICKEYGVPLTAHTYAEAAQALGIGRIHLPLASFLKMSEEEKRFFSVIGVSTHSPQEAVLAEQAGASYVTAGHVFATDCKKGLAPRGLGFLREVCQSVQIPVYAIGGITPENRGDCMEAGASGVCLMSYLMTAETITI